jgi:hypothetical protein
LSIAKYHADLLRLIEVSGPFLSLPVLVQRFPQGMDVHDPEHSKALRQVHEEWDEDQCGDRPDRAIHRQWIDWVLRNTLDLGDVLVEGQDVPQSLKADLPEHGETLRPDKVVMEPGGSKARLLIQTYPLKQKLGRVVEGKPWAASPDTRMMQLLHDTGVRLGLVTNGDQWMLVDAPKGETTGYASWFAPLWLEEPKTLQAFRTLLSSHRFFGVPDEESLERLLAQSAQDQQEVTDQLGYQVRRAVEVLVSSIDKANRDSGGALLKGVPEAVLYEAALTVMMRLVFLFCAEERDLLLLGDELYDKNYAVSTLREQLRGTATDFGEEVLERRNDAWSRLLTTFRAVYGGVRHDRLKIPAYKGKLFDPDRFPFLEGRPSKTSWKDTPGQPLPVDNRTVLHLLEALQVLQVKLPGGGPATPRKLSFRALQITQIGHVYEGLLDHTAVRAAEPVLGLSGSRDSEPEVALSKLEALAAKGEDDLLKFVKDVTGRSSVATVKRLLASGLDDQALSRFRTACQGDKSLWERVRPLAGLVRLDTFDYPVVVLPGGVYVTAGADRRSSGTHYTPESLTEPIVHHTLEPLAYVGPAEGKPRDQWRLKSAVELLDLKICDMACGSGAFLVQVCIYLSLRLLEAWEEAERRFEGTPRITPYGELSRGLPEEQLIPLDRQERVLYARRLVAQRCLYGVDKNPLAVEMAKLSLWLLTLAKDKPFTFLDHAIRCGDSLVGVNNEQLKTFSLDGKGIGITLPNFLDMIPKSMEATRLLRVRLEKIADDTIGNVEEKQRLFDKIRSQTKRLNYAADRLLAASWKAVKPTERVGLLRMALPEVDDRIRDVPPDTLEAEGIAHRESVECPEPFHWALEFPEVFLDRGGFDAFVGNPPFMGGQKITGNLGNDYRDYLVEHLARGKRGSADLCAYFFLRAEGLLRDGGQCGFLATNTIAQGDTREVGLDQLTANGCVIPRAVPSRKWPGTASLEVAHVWLRKGTWTSPFVLDDKPASGVTSMLTEPYSSELGLDPITIRTGMSGDLSEAKPYRLVANAGKSFIGSYVLGMGFVMEPEEARRLIDKDPRNKDVLFPYLNGEDLNSRPDQSPSRWVINFFDWPLDRESALDDYQGPVAADYPDCLAIVETRVRPEREKLRHNNVTGRDRADKWWRFGRGASGLYSTIAGMERVMVVARTAKYRGYSFVDNHNVLDVNLVVFALTSMESFGSIQSNVHEVWVNEHSSTLETRQGYRPSDCFETFPFLVNSETLDVLAESYYENRLRILLSRQEGLTKTYNRFHDPNETAADIETLRELHVEMDKAVAAAYDWSNLDLGHGFHETKQGLRFTISEPARREVLARLLRLNHERYAEEVAQGLHDKTGKPKATGRKGKKAPTGEATLLF